MTVTTAGLTLEAIVERGRRELGAAAELLSRIEATPPPYTRHNTLDPLNELHLHLANAASEAGLLAEVHPEQEVRDAAEDVERRANELRTAVQQSRPLYAALGALDPARLDAVARRCLELTRADMRRGGVELADAARERVRSLRDELVLIGQEFSRNIRDDVRSVALDPSELDGLPDDCVAAHPAGPDGNVRLTTDYPDYLPFMSYATSDVARRALHYEFNNRAAPRNLPVLERMLELRHELARLLGYAHWADYVTEDKMLSSAQAVRDFVEEASRIAAESARTDLAELVERKGRDQPGALTIGDWELSYYVQRVKAERYDFDPRVLRPYFEYRAVRQAILDLTSELFGLTFTPARDDGAWHASVETFEVAVDGEPMGRISLDMHPRPGKYKHAACFTWRVGVGGKQLPHSVLVCNFPDPAASAGPALMDHREVVTFFHEFGHLVHGIVRGKVPWVRLAPVAEWDFVEAPSQFLEEWIYDFDVLRRFARHVETGETIPAAFVERLRAARDFARGVGVKRQLYFAALSLYLHDRDPAGLDTTRAVFELAERYSPTDIMPGTHFEASFGHLEGYSALYHTYAWSRALAEDLLSVFAGDLLDLRQTRRYRDLILAPGGTKPAAQLVHDFLGRPHTLDAFRRWLAPRTVSA